MSVSGGEVRQLTYEMTNTYTRDQVHQLVDTLLDALKPDDAGAVMLDNKKNTQSYAQKLTLSVQEAADMIGVSKPIMYRLLDDSEVRSIRIGRKILIPQESVTDYLRGA